MKIWSAIKWVALSISLFISIFLLLEVSSRAFYPEYTGKTIYSGSSGKGSKSWGVSIHHDRSEIDILRVPYKGYSLDGLKNKDMFLVLGSSPTQGYGSAYEDIFWVRAERMMSQAGEHPVMGFPASNWEAPRNTDKTLRAYGQFFSTMGSRVEKVLYQYSLADLVPVPKRRAQILENRPAQSLRDDFMRFRQKYFHRSTFFHLTSVYSNKVLHNWEGSCEERGVGALEVYSWSYGNKAVKEESEQVWQEFEKTLERAKLAADELKADFAVMMWPVIFDIDSQGLHLNYNPHNLDLSCATINPRKRLAAIAQKLGIAFIDPTGFLRENFKNRIKEGNYAPFFLPGDVSHVTPLANSLIGEYVAAHYFKKGAGS
jgi:hypothetical protein